MRNRAKSNSGESHIHYHYHYHYNLPTDAPTDRFSHEKLTDSYIYERDEENQESPPKAKKDSTLYTEGDQVVTPKRKETERHRTEGNLTLPINRIKNMRQSEVWQVKKEFPSYYSTEPREVSSIKARSVVEEEVQQNEEEMDCPPSNNLQFKSRVTEAETWLDQSQLLTVYEKQLKQSRRELQRLRMVQQQCIYLREAFFKHYTEYCPGKFDK